MKEPKIRFKEFEGEWETSRLDSCVDFLDNLRKPIEEGNRIKGIYPYYGASGIVDYVNDYIFVEELILLSEDGANITDRNYPVCFLASGKYWVNNHAHVLKAKDGFVNCFVSNAMERKDYSQYNTGMAMPKLNKEVCKNIPLTYPLIEEQQSIASFFTTIDAQISASTSRLASLKQIKAASLQAMFPQEGETVPKLRFKGFEGEWENVKLGDFGHVAMCKRIFKEQTTGSGDVPFFKIGTFGKAPDAYISYDLYYEYKSKYPFPNKGDILISAAGTIGRTVEYNGEDAYFQDSNIVWLKHNEEIENCFLKQLYPILNWYSLEGATIMRLYNNNILETRVCIPTIAEQKMIGDYFTNLDRQITLQARRLEKLKQIKAACLDKMFV